MELTIKGLTINTEEAKKRIKALENTIMYDLMKETMKLAPENTGNLRRYDGEYMRIIRGNNIFKK